MIPPGQAALGVPLPDWTARPMPPARPLTGRHCTLEPLVPRCHAAGLHAALAQDDAGWTWMGYGPFVNADAYHAWAERHSGRSDPQFLAILDRAGPAGVLALHRIQPEHGTAELGHVRFSPRLQRTTAATEAVFLILRRLFADLGYRRVEWKCDTLNTRSRRAAERLGFTFEGVFRNHLVVKGRNRDTAWYAMTDAEWRARAPGYERWLAEAAEGPQRRPLSDLLAEAISAAF
ncbi:MAG: GNAT family N-acetyltransferase [Alkalilacustris sp.]